MTLIKNSVILYTNTRFDYFYKKLKEGDTVLDMNRNKIIMLMLHLGMGVADLSRVSGVSECSIRNILTRGQRPRFSTVVKLANALQVDAIEIIKEV